MLWLERRNEIRFVGFDHDVKNRSLEGVGVRFQIGTWDTETLPMSVMVKSRSTLRDAPSRGALLGSITIFWYTFYSLFFHGVLLMNRRVKFQMHNGSLHEDATSDPTVTLIIGNDARHFHIRLWNPTRETCGVGNSGSHRDFAQTTW